MKIARIHGDKEGVLFLSYSSIFPCFALRAPGGALAICHSIGQVKAHISTWGVQVEDCHIYLLWDTIRDEGFYREIKFVDASLEQKDESPLRRYLEI